MMPNSDQNVCFRDDTPKKPKKTPSFTIGNSDVKIDLRKHLKKYKKHPKKYNEIKVIMLDFSETTFQSYQEICSSFPENSIKCLNFRFAEHF